MSQFMLEWHGNRSRLGRSFLMYTEDMDAQRFTELAQWLGQPCTFHSAPNANEYDPTLGGAPEAVGSPSPFVTFDAALEPAMAVRFTAKTWYQKGGWRADWSGGR